MKTLLSLLFTLTLSLSCHAQSGKVVHITKTIKGLDQMIVEPGRYSYRIVSGNKVEISIGQDCTHITQAQLKMFPKEVWTAAQGHGYVFELKRTAVKAQPNDASKTIGIIDGESDGYPDDYECLGVVGNYYKIRNYNGYGKWKVGYVKKNMVEWHINPADCGGCIR